jgi:ssDNA-binding Zn-finger/Zn-ribbon topoisomerase 1
MTQAGIMRRRVRTVTTKEQRRPEYGEAFVEDCPACGCGNLLIKRQHKGGTLFVGCDCFRTTCSCDYTYSVEELPASESESAGMTEFARVKARIANASRCRYHMAPMSERTGTYGLFACCTVPGCKYRKSLETPVTPNDKPRIFLVHRSKSTSA